MLVSPARYRHPFSTWTNVASELDWWKAHNKLKHDRLANIDYSTLGALLDALCGLHQIMSRRLDLVPILIRRGWFPKGHWPIDHIIGEAAKGALPARFVVQTELFATPAGFIARSPKGEEHFPPDILQFKSSIHHYQCNDDFYRFFGST